VFINSTAHTAVKKWERLLDVEIIKLVENCSFAKNTNLNLNCNTNTNPFRNFS